MTGAEEAYKKMKKRFENQGGTPPSGEDEEADEFQNDNTASPPDSGNDDA